MQANAGACGAGGAGTDSIGSFFCTQLRCPAAGKGKKRGRFDIAEFFERIAKGRRNAKGKRRRFMCFSEYVDFHKSRPEPFRLTDVQAAEKWKRDLQNPAVIKDRVRGPDANGVEGKGPWVRALRRKSEHLYMRNARGAKDNGLQALPCKPASLQETNVAGIEG